MKRRCCEAPDHELVAVFKGEGSKVLERQIESCEPCMLRMESLSPVSGLLREAVTEEVGEVEALWAQARIQARLESPEPTSLMDSVSEWLNIQFGSRRRLAFALGGAMMLGAVVAPSIAHFLATDESSPEQVKKNGFQSASVIVESVEVESVGSFSRLSGAPGVAHLSEGHTDPGRGHENPRGLRTQKQKLLLEALS